MPDEYPHVVCLLVTYKRTCLAVRTVEAVLRNLRYPGPISWHVADDGSPPEHVQAILASIPPGVLVTQSNAGRKGVGRSMNLGMAAALERADLILWLEDDWELAAPFDLTPCVRALQEREDFGMVRLGYISPGIRGTLVAGGGHLWWRLDKGVETYTFTGHAGLRHRRFCVAYGPYQEGLAPGATELFMCGTYNARPGPAVVVPAWTGEWGAFGHIGAESLKDLVPEHA